MGRDFKKIDIHFCRSIQYLGTFYGLEIFGRNTSCHLGLHQFDRAHPMFDLKMWWPDLLHFHY